MQHPIWQVHFTKFRGLIQYFYYYYGLENIYWLWSRSSLYSMYYTMSIILYNMHDKCYVQNVASSQQLLAHLFDYVNIVPSH